MSQVFSPIQNYILSKLKNAKTLRYSEMQLPGTPNDLYNYHLQFLVKKELVEKSDDGYRLSPAGIRHVADPYALAGDPQVTSLFKINPITIVSRVRAGKIEILNQVRNSHPSFGKVGVMGGIIWKGEPLAVGASRKLREETGLEADFRLVCMERRIMYVDNELFSDVLFPIMHADSCSGELHDTEFGHNLWVDIDQAIRNESAEFDSIGSIKTVLAAIKDGGIKTMPFSYKEDIKKGSF